MSFMFTYTGKTFDPLMPDPDLIELEDIAHALSNLCRYNGHCSKFYSVAQHCVLMAEYAPDHLKLGCLMHDAAEAYLTDMPRPLKHLPGFADAYREAEFNLLDTILPVFGIDPAVMDEIEPWDQFMLAWEQRDLMPQSSRLGPWYPHIRRPAERILAWGPGLAKSQFLAMYAGLTASQTSLVLPTEAR